MPSSLYARTARTVLVHPALGVVIVAGSVMHAAGHAALAAAGGALARTLAGGAAPMDGGSTSSLLRFLGRGDVMLGLALAGFVAAVAKLVGGVMAGWGEARVAGEVGASLRLDVLSRVLARARHRDHGQAQSAGAEIADLASLTTHVADVERGVAQGILAEARAIVQLVPLAVLLAWLAPRLAGSAGLALAGFAALVMIARRALKKNHARAVQEAESLLGAADEAVRHADLWATYGAEARVRDHVGRLGRIIVTSTARLRARAALLSGTSEVLGALALVLTLLLVSLGVIGGVDRGGIVPFAIAFFMAYKPLREVIEGRLTRARAEEALAATDGPAAAAVVERPAKTWALAPLSVRDAVTAHGAHAPLSFRVPAGSIVAIVGPTGVGKSSLLRALLGLDALVAGSIRWGDAELGEAGIGPSERPFAWVPQDAPILGDTLAANISMGGTGDARAVLAELGAATLAGALGDATLATHRKVSGGERQWISVARALAARLPVLLLDEPTASLDAAAQERMLRALAGLRGKRTVIIVTHRAESLAIADLVVRLDRDDSQNGARRDDDAARANELAIEDVGAVVLGETERELAGERIDTRTDERSPG